MRNLLKKQVPSLLMALVMLLTIVPVAAAAEPDNDIHCTVEIGESATLRTADFQGLLDPEYRLQYVEFSRPRGLDTWGILQTRDHDRHADRLLEADLPADFIVNPALMRDGDYVLADTVFTPRTTAAGKTVSFNFTAFGENQQEKLQTRSGELTFRMEKTAAEPASRTASLRYTVEAGAHLAMDPEAFFDLFEADRTTTRALDYVVFEGYDHLDDFGSFSARRQDGRFITLDEAGLDRNVRLHYDKANITGAAGCDLRTLEFDALPKASGTLTLRFTMVGLVPAEIVSGTLELTVGKPADGGKLPVTVQAGTALSLGASRFAAFFDKAKNTTKPLDCLLFTGYDRLDDFGTFSARRQDGRFMTLDEAALNQSIRFHADKAAIAAPADCDLSTLEFHAHEKAQGTVKLSFLLAGTLPGEKVTGTLEITVGKSTPAQKLPEIRYLVRDEVKFDPADFQKLYNRVWSGDLSYVKFTDTQGLESSSGLVFARYGRADEAVFTAETLSWNVFGTSACTSCDDKLSDLSYVPGRRFHGPVVLGFRAFGVDGHYTDGRVLIGTQQQLNPQPTAPDLLYRTAGTAAIHLSASDLARFYREKFPKGQLTSVRMDAVPEKGSLRCGRKTAVTAETCGSMEFFHDPASGQLSLHELTYLPVAGNYCIVIPFTAKGTAGTVSGTLHIGVTKNALSEIYTARVAGTKPIACPADTLAGVVQKAAGAKPAAVRFLTLPRSAQGTLTVSLDKSRPVTLSDRLDMKQLAKVSFAPAAKFLGNVELPYEALDAKGNAFASGVISIGIIRTDKDFKDVKPGLWCYKYVKELSGSGIIGGYADGTFREKNPLTWRAAIKLICLANGVGKSGDSLDTFMKLAAEKKWITGKEEGAKPITRQEFSQVAAKAMGLSLKNLPTQSPFSDCRDPYVLALSQAGIINGYADGTFHPANTLTRGHISAIIWRMNQYQ